MATLDDKLLGEKLQNYCSSSSEDEGMYFSNTNFYSETINKLKIMIKKKKTEVIMIEKREKIHQ
jgi:hypothetical protein